MCLGKKKLIIDTMQDALLWLAGKLDWQKEPFKEAYREAYRKNLMLEGFGKKTWVSPSSKYRVRIYSVFELEMVYLYGVLLEWRRKNWDDSISRRGRPKWVFCGITSGKESGSRR